MKQASQTVRKVYKGHRSTAYIKAASDPDQLLIYQIRIQGHLGCEWTDWFGGLAVTLEDGGETLLAGPVVDQAALHGLLKKVRDLGLTLISVNRAGSEP
jgi:hypothetical protein